MPHFSTDLPELVIPDAEFASSSPSYYTKTPTSPSGFDLNSLRESLEDAERTAQESLGARARGGTIINSKSSVRLADTSTPSSRPEMTPDQLTPTEVKELLFSAKSGLKSSLNPSTSVPSNLCNKAVVGARAAKRGTGGGTTVKNSKIAANFVPPKQLLLYLVRMGSFTSMPKVVPSADSDDHDLDYPTEPMTVESFLKRNTDQMENLPKPIERWWRRKRKIQLQEDQGENVRILQWNVLSQALGTKNDNFVRCPASALDWRTRRFRMLEEIVRHKPDIICLQEVDHFPFLQKSLRCLNYEGEFLPKPDSPCLYLPENTGPDGCAIFYRKDKFDLERCEKRVIQVWNVESNQVLLLACLRSKQTSSPLMVATTHLKARNGALLSTLRNEQGKDILDIVKKNRMITDVEHFFEEDRTPVIITGDFNAEPSEPVFDTMTSDKNLSLQSAYDPESYTTWKIREDGEHKENLDYIFYSSNDQLLSVDGVLEMPSGEQIGADRVPSMEYASDHFSLVADFTLKGTKRIDRVKV